MDRPHGPRHSSTPAPGCNLPVAASPSLRRRLAENLPQLDPTGLRDCQIGAITNLEASFKKAKPRALVQMATGSGKTFTAITSIYRLLKHARVKRVLFLVDTRNLGEQEFIAYNLLSRTPSPFVRHASTATDFVVH